MRGQPFPFATALTGYLVTPMVAEAGVITRQKRHGDLLAKRWWLLPGCLRAINDPFTPVPGLTKGQTQ